MRVVIFNSPERVTQYPFEGASAFKNTKKVGADIVGEYSGSASEEDLPSYTGTWPIVAADQVARADVYDFKNWLGAALRIKLRALAKSDGVIEDFMDMLTSAERKFGYVSSEDSDFMAALKYLEDTSDPDFSDITARFVNKHGNNV